MERKIDSSETHEWKKAVLSMQIEQYSFSIKTKGMSCQLIDNVVLQNCLLIRSIEKGFLQLFLQHTSASLSINENASPDVRRDMVDALDRIVPEDQDFRHKEEGSDDMPAHVKSSLMGATLQIPIRAGRLEMGTWQGIYLNEHRRAEHERRIFATVWGL